MAADKYTAVWVSHTSIHDFLECPRAYFLKNVYKNPDTGHKIKLMSPALSLGQAVHEVIESLSVLPTDKRFNESLVNKFEIAWKKVAGKKGGFLNRDVEQLYKNRGLAMLERVRKNPGPLKNLAVKIHMDLPQCWLSEEENIMLSGKVDWLEYLPETDSVHIIDFKTSKNDENDDSLQLPIYNILVSTCQPRKVIGASYWYIERSDTPIEKKLPDLEESRERILKIARQIKTARALVRFKCEYGGCRACTPFERILKGEAELVGVDEYGRDTYILEEVDGEIESEVL